MLRADSLGAMDIRQGFIGSIGNTPSSGTFESDKAIKQATVRVHGRD